MLLLASCNKKELEVVEKKELLVSAHVKFDNTKAIKKTPYFADKESIGVVLMNAIDGSRYDPLVPTNLKFTLNHIQTILPEEDSYYEQWSTNDYAFLTLTKAKVYAYYPYDEYIDREQVFSEISLEIPSIAKTKDIVDYMYATPIDQDQDLVNKDNNNIILTMNHALSQVSFLIYKEKYTEPGIVTEFVLKDVSSSSHIKVNDKTEKVFMNILTGNVTGGIKSTMTRELDVPIVLNDGAADFPSSILSVLKDQVNEKGFSTLVIPTGTIMPGELIFKFTIDNRQLSVTNTNQIKFDAGKQYIYKIKLTGSGLKISSISISDWNSVIAEDVDIILS